MRYDQTSEDVGGLFEQAPPIERRDWRDPEDEVDRIDAIRPKIGYKSGRILRTEATEFYDLGVRQAQRRELLALRRRVEGWARDAQANGTLDTWDPMDILRDLVTVLDERLADRGAVERGVPG